MTLSFHPTLANNAEREPVPMKNRYEPPGGASVPARQDAYRIAQQKAVESLTSQSSEQLEWLGARRDGLRWRLPVLSEHLLVDVGTGDVLDNRGATVRPGWLVLALHYLDVRERPATQPPEATFASLRSARVYGSVYENRVNRRLCATVGRDRQSLRAAARAIGARECSGGDFAMEVHVFPRIRVRLMWYAGDEELSPSCTLLLAANIESFLCTEDIVVLSESLVSRLCGKSFSEV
jgi:hypothetical protein